MTQYPSAEQIEAADKNQLGGWIRRLPSPGLWAVERDDFETVLAAENKAMERILARFRQMGGWSPDVSKAVGWE